MSVIDLFSDKSDLYAAARPKYPEKLYHFLASQVDSPKRVWDCGAGSGQASIGLSKYFAEVYATDISDRQIQYAIQADNIHYSIQPAEKTNFPDAYFDAVIVAQALHWFDHQQFWSEVKRVLRQNGLFAAWCYNFFFISPKIDAVIEESIHQIIEPYWSSRIVSLCKGYSDVDFPFELIQVPSIDLTVYWNLSELLTYIHTWSATRQCMQQQGKEFYEAASSQLSTVWGNLEEKKEVKMNFHLIAGLNK